MEFRTLDPPSSGRRIDVEDGRQIVPEDPIVPYLEGDGVGPEIWAAARAVLDAAVEKVFGGQRQVHWFEIFAGRKAHDRFQDWLPDETVEAIRHYRVALKGPLETPVDGSIRRLSVSLRQRLDLYASVRPIRWLEGVPSPIKHPEKLDLVLFRENTECLHAGLEWSATSDEAQGLVHHLNDTLETNVREGSALALHPSSAYGSKRLVRRAIQHALDRGRASVTLAHAGDVLKMTEGAFRDWGLELAREEFAASTISEADLREKYDGDRPDNKVVVKDRRIDALFQQVQLRPGEHSVVATTNLHADALFSTLIAQVGGLGGSANVGDEVALFETTHEPLSELAGQDQANPGSLILAGVMLLEHLGWHEAGRMVTNALQETLRQKRVTADLERQMSGATLVKCSEFAQAVVGNLGSND
ncbi:MAG: isocitrate/isopropylmalate family dehydrogenase [Acidobacteriota bacterium]